jgi:transcriptional regulator with PAS, ATPase and Fis domain
MTSPRHDKPASAEKPFRWSVFFRAAPNPIFVLNPRQRILYVNSAWEALTGFTLDDVRGQPCRRRRAEAATERKDLLLASLAPPPSVRQGRLAEVRRRLPTATGMALATVSFFPLQDAQGNARILGKVHLAKSEPVSTHPLPDKLLALHDRVTRAHALEHLPANTPATARLHDQVRLAAGNRAPASIVGPVGAGKQWLARCLHHETFGLEKFFAAVDCERLPADAVAEIVLSDFARPLPLGTIYLRAPERLPRDLQARLADRLDQEADDSSPRYVAGFTTEPSELVRRGVLLADLDGRLGVTIMSLPALSERGADWPFLLESLLARASAAMDKPTPEVVPEAQQILSAHKWPGNLAELYRVLLAAYAHMNGARLEVADLPYYLRQGPAPPPASLPLDALLEKVERNLLALALRLAKNKKGKAAELLAIWRPRLVRRLEALGIKDS